MISDPNLLGFACFAEVVPVSSAFAGVVQVRRRKCGAGWTPSSSTFGAAVLQFLQLEIMDSSVQTAQQPSGMDILILESTKIAEKFIKKYYSTLDAQPKPEPLSTSIQSLYAPEARITWNGNPIRWDKVQEFWRVMPKSEHVVQGFDCHPIPGTAQGTGPPSLLLTVTGQVNFGPHPFPAPGVPLPRTKDQDLLPRVWSQSLILQFVGAGGGGTGGEDGYVVTADSYRFC
ncbi:NTF2-like protein [Meredithblackwellia eburnea MCA 4105]